MISSINNNYINFIYYQQKKSNDKSNNDSTFEDYL